jgi:uncharacterized protein YcfJ
MVAQTSLHLDVESAQTYFSQDVASVRRTRLVWFFQGGALGLAVLMLIGLAAPLTSHASAKPSQYASAFNPAMPAFAPGMRANHQEPLRTAALSMDARLPKEEARAKVIGAAAVGAVAGVYLGHDLQTGLILGSAAAYAATTASQVGSYAAKAGEVAVKAYDKTKELNNQYDLLPKLKSATDTVVVAGDNLNKNYGVTDKIDERLKLTQAAKKATSKFDVFKASVTSKADDLKAKASDSDD